MRVFDASELSGENSRFRQQGKDSNQSYADFEYTKCGYGKLIWPDGSSFEGYWINGQACGLGVFRASAASEELYEGFWQQDR